MATTMPNGQRTTASRLADLLVFLRRGPRTLPQLQAATGLSKRYVCELLELGRQQGLIASARDGAEVWHRAVTPASTEARS